MSKNPSNKIEKSLNTLALIIILLSFGAVGSFVYESKIPINENRITGQITDMGG